MARAGEEDLELHYTAEFRTHPPPQTAGTVYFAMDVDDVPAVLGSRPDRLTEVRPQDQFQRRTVQQIVDAVDDPAPQMVGQLLNLAQFFDTPLPDPEQVIEVPKILSDDVPMRSEPQLVVEVPTIVSRSLLQLITKQNVDVPVPGRGGRISGLQGFLPGKNSKALPSEERISERIVEQIVDFPVGGSLQDFRPGQNSSASSSSPAGVHGSAAEPGECFFFALFPKEKSAQLGPHPGSELGADFTSSTPAPEQEGFFTDAAGVWMQFPDVWWKLLGSDPEVWRLRDVPCIWQSLVRCSVFACGVFSWEFASGNFYVFSALWFDSGYMSASVYEASVRLSHVLYVKVAGPAVLECRRGGGSRAPTVAARRILDSCCMPVVCNDRCCVVDDVAQFIDVGGRRCVAAATSSSCRS